MGCSLPSSQPVSAVPGRTLLSQQRHPPYPMSAGHIQPPPRPGRSHGLHSVPSRQGLYTGWADAARCRVHAGVRDFDFSAMGPQPPPPSTVRESGPRVQVRLFQEFTPSVSWEGPCRAQGHTSPRFQDLLLRDHWGLFRRQLGNSRLWHRKRKLREARLPCQSHTAGRWAEWDFTVTPQDGGRCLVGTRIPLLGCHRYVCPEGSSSPHAPTLACPAGTFSNRRDLSDLSQCEICPSGLACPRGE